MNETKKLAFKLGPNANWILPNGQEVRYVRELSGYFTVYLSPCNGKSSHADQFGFKETTVAELIEQAKIVINHYKQQVAYCLEIPAQKIYFEWLDKAELPSDSNLKLHHNEITDELEDLAFSVGLSEIKFRI